MCGPLPAPAHRSVCGNAALSLPARYPRLGYHSDGLALRLACPPAGVETPQLRMWTWTYERVIAVNGRVVSGFAQTGGVAG